MTKASFYDLACRVDESQTMQTFIASIFSRFGQMIPGVTPQEKGEVALDTINTLLDAGGVADPTGITDGVNGLIYLLRAAASKEPDVRNKNLINALISVVSAVPFGDLVKLLKAKKYMGAAKGLAKVARPVRAVARAARTDRYMMNQGRLAPQWMASAAQPAPASPAPA